MNNLLTGADGWRMVVLVSLLVVPEIRTVQSLSFHFQEMGDAMISGDMTNLETQFITSLFLSSSFKILGLGLTKFISKCRRILVGVEGIVDGKFNRELLGPQEQSAILTGVTKALPVGLILLKHEGMLHDQVYYTAARVQVIASKEGVITMITLPLTAPGQRMKLYEVIQRPVRELQTQRMVLDKPEGRYSLVDSRESAYAILHERGFGRCRRSQVWICPADVLPYHANRPSCILASYKGTRDEEQDVCRWEVALNGAPPVWMLIRRRKPGQLVRVLVDQRSRRKVTRWWDVGIGSSAGLNVLGVLFLRARRLYWWRRTPAENTAAQTGGDFVEVRIIRPDHVLPQRE